MPKVKQIGTNSYQYQCECGAEITLHQDFPLKKAIKCFQCGKKDELEREKNHVTNSNE
jgi:predicted SprT family Zn-dependent metalloprotease